MAKKNKNNQVMNKEEQEDARPINETASKIGYRIILKTKTFIIIDKYGINVKINLPMQELVKYQVNGLYYIEKNI